MSNTVGRTFLGENTPPLKVFSGHHAGSDAGFNAFAAARLAGESSLALPNLGFPSFENVFPRTQRLIRR